ncbi:MAG: reductive dehalogenase [Candidatus Bathyarchaeia archaeon]
MRHGSIFPNILYAGSLGSIISRKEHKVGALESMLTRFERNLNFQRSLRRLIGVKELEAPTYEVGSGYVRYNQRYDLTIGRPSWDQTLIGKLRTQEENVMNLVGRGVAGYTLLDYALADAAYTMARTFKTDINYPNSGFLSWTPLRRPTYRRVEAERLKVTDEVKMSRLIKKVAMWFGASVVRITLLDRRWVYSHWYDDRASPHRNPPIVFSDESGYEDYVEPTQLEDGTQIIPKEMKYVISLGFEMDYESIMTAPTAIAFAGTLMYGYRTIIQTVASLAEFIRGLGYNAIPSSNDTALNVPIAIDAGLGEDGRLGGCLLSPEYGPRLRLAKVITDLPLSIDKPVTFGVHEFCEDCGRCARLCPAQAIPYGPRTMGYGKNDVGAPTISENIGPLRWINNQERCRVYFAVGGTNCGVCIRVCPWNRPNTKPHIIWKYLAVKGGTHIRNVMLWTDEVLGGGEQLSPERWWREEAYSMAMKHQ